MSIFTDLDAKIGSVFGAGNQAKNTISGLSNKVQDATASLQGFLSKRGNTQFGEGYNLTEYNNIEAFEAKQTAESKKEQAVNSLQTTYLMYPLDLFDPNRQNKTATIIFHILVNEDSKFAKNNKDAVGATGSIVDGKNTLTDGASALLGGAADTVAGFIADTTKTGGKLLGKVASLGGDTGAKIGNEIAEGSATAAMKIEKAGKDVGEGLSKSMKKLKKSIALPMPNQVQAQYSMSYSTVDAGMLGALLLDKNGGAPSSLQHAHQARLVLRWHKKQVSQAIREKK